MKITKTQEAHPGQKVKPIDTRDKVKVITTDKHRKPGTTKEVHPIMAKQGIERGIYRAYGDKKADK
jgi:hypothetical protein